MNPNILLALATGLATALLVSSATVFGETTPWWRLVAVALVVTAGTALLEPWMNKRMGRTSEPMIVAGGNLGIAAVLPLLIMSLAVLPMLFRSLDFGFIVIIGAVLFGITLNSARRSLTQP